jgi:hypothetical protein
VLYLLGLVAAGGLFVLALVLALMHVAGWRVSDARDVLLNRAYESFTHDGIVIPGLEAGRGARLVIRLLSDEEDARRQLLASQPAARR